MTVSGTRLSGRNCMALINTKAFFSRNGIHSSMQVTVTVRLPSGWMLDTSHSSQPAPAVTASTEPTIQDWGSEFGTEQIWQSSADTAPSEVKAPRNRN